MLTFGTETFGDDELLVMAIINRTPDSFYDRGASYAHDAALDRVGQVVAEGAQIIDIGGVKAGPGEVVDPEAPEASSGFFRRRGRRAIRGSSSRWTPGVLTSQLRCAPKSRPPTRGGWCAHMLAT